MTDLTDRATVAILASMPPDTGLSAREAAEAAASLEVLPLVSASRGRAIMDGAWINDMVDRRHGRYFLRPEKREAVGAAFRRMFLS